MLTGLNFTLYILQLRRKGKGIINKLLGLRGHLLNRFTFLNLTQLRDC